MPIADYDTYCAMIDNAQKNNFAYAAINITSLPTINGTIAAFAEMKTDGIIQVSTGGGQFASGLAVKDAVLGAQALAEYVHLVADQYDVNIALHTDHCMPEKVDSFLKPLIEISKKRVAAGQKPLFNSHMFDGSPISLEENMDISVPLLKECAELGIILEVEAGVVGGEEDGHDTSNVSKDKLYTTDEDMLYVYKRLSEVPNARFMFAATFGNVHGVYKPGNVVLKPGILRDGQAALQKEYGADAGFDFVFHGGSGSTEEEIAETLEYGVIKMNVDTDTQYAFTRPIVDHIFNNYDGVLKVEGEVGNKKAYDPRAYLKLAENGIKERVKEAIRNLHGEGTTLFGK
ncbi:MAG: class II fructose-bisphosphate aldolase [Lentisphaerales bacterium]|nr:class II fructose-bisphosphate aldolase [Lentisphaerales bacterium]